MQVGPSNHFVCYNMMTSSMRVNLKKILGAPSWRAGATNRWRTCNDGGLWVKSVCAAKSSSMRHLSPKEIESTCRVGADMGGFLGNQPIHQFHSLLPLLTHMADGS